MPAQPEVHSGTGRTLLPQAPWPKLGPGVANPPERTPLNTQTQAGTPQGEGLADLQRQLERTGLFKSLEEAGVKTGDTVRIGDFELEWT